MQVTWKERSFELEVTAEQFAQVSQPLVDRLRTPVLQALKDSNLPVADLSEVVLVGGATRMPVVRRAVTKMFGRFPATSVHPDEAVAVGAAIQAGLKARAADLKEVVLTDVCPYTLGVQTTERLPSGNFEHGIFTPILERNTTVPASRESVFSNVADGQKVVIIEIYQGESRKVSSNIHLGSVEVPIPYARSGEIAVHCRFTYDINGILEVDVHVPKTGQKRQLVIIDDPNAFTGAELEKRRALLAALKVHPRDDDANRALLARIERCYEQALGDKRTLIGSWISQFNAILDRQEPRQINEARAALSDSLDKLEGETYL
jgi:molecular chaperone HscC